MASDHASNLLQSARAVLDSVRPGLRNPLGNLVLIDDDCVRLAGIDAERASLVPSLAQALESPDELWSLSGVGREPGIEHWPHLLTIANDGSSELLLAGTRSLADNLQLSTWFRVQDGTALLRRFREQARLAYPTRAFTIQYSRARDVAYVLPARAVPYRVERFADDPGIFAYVRAEGHPALVGLEIHSAQSMIEAAPPELTNILATVCDVEGEHARLVDHLSAVLTRSAA